MSTRIQKIGLVNGVKPTGKNYSVSDMIQESYRLSYKAKDLKNEQLINLTESHLANIKKDITNRKLSEDLDVLKGLVKLGKDQKLKDIEEVDDKAKRRRKRSVNSCVKPMAQVKESSWSKAKMSKSLKGFRESAKSKLFYKEFYKFNKNIKDKNPITMTEAVSLYKASNSCLTHLTVTLEKNPEFRGSFRECTDILARDNRMLLDSIQEGKLPSRSLLESFVAFTNVLLESDAPEKLDPELYEDADMEQLDDRDVLNEDADMEELDDRDVINEDADMEELDDRDVINEDADMEELDDRDVINEDVEDVESSDVTSVDLTPEEIDILRSILSKISGMNEEEDVEVVPDEEVIPEIEDEYEEDFEDELDDIEEDEEIEDFEDDEIEDFEDEVDDFEEDEEIEDFEDEVEDFEEDEEIDDEIPEEDSDLEGSLKDIRDSIDKVIDDLSSEEINEEDEVEDEEPIYEEDEVEDEEFETELSESAIRRIKKCF